MALDIANFGIFPDNVDDDVSVANLTTRLGQLAAGSITFGSSSSTHLNVLGNIAVGGTVDGVDIAALATTVAGLGGGGYTLPAATSTALGGLKIISTAASAPVQVVTTTANRNYSIQHMTSGTAMVNVPWTDTTYSLATASVSGLCQVHSSIEENSTVCESTPEGRRYKIQHDAASDLSVCVPWTDTVYTHPTTAGYKHIPSGGSAGNYLRHTGTSGTVAWSAFPNTITTAQANAITANTAKVTFPGFGTTSSTAMRGDTSIPVDLTVSGAGTVHADNYINTLPNFTNVQSAGAIMDTEVTDLAGLKSVTISTLQPKPSEGAFANGDKTKLDGIEANADVTDATNVAAAGALMDSELTDLAGVKAMTVSDLATLNSPALSGTPSAPTAGTGTNSTQIATTAFVKASIDARYSYQYINFSFKVSGVSAQKWYFPGQDGVNYYLWGNNVTGTNSGGSSMNPVDIALNDTIDVDRYDYQSGIIIPKACELVSFHGQIRHHGYAPNTIKPVFALFKAALPGDGTTSTITPACIAFNDDSLIGSGNRLNRINKIESTHTASLSAYDVIYPAYGPSAAPTTNGTVRGMITIVLKTLIP